MKKCKKTIMSVQVWGSFCLPFRVTMKQRRIGPTSLNVSSSCFFVESTKGIHNDIIKWVQRRAEEKSIWASGIREYLSVGERVRQVANKNSGGAMFAFTSPPVGALRLLRLSHPPLQTPERGTTYSLTSALNLVTPRPCCPRTKEHESWTDPV